MTFTPFEKKNKRKIKHDNQTAKLSLAGTGCKSRPLKRGFMVHPEKSYKSDHNC